MKSGLWLIIGFLATSSALAALQTPAARMAAVGQAAVVDPRMGLSVYSTVKQLRIAKAARLPMAPSREELTDFCKYKNVVVDPTTMVGKMAAARGWHVTSEESLGRYEAIGIFSESGDGTSGTCLIEDGSIAIFENDRLVAIVYAQRAQKDTSGLIGGVRKTTLPDTVRVSDWTPGGPTADLKATVEGLAIVPIAAVDPACEGRVQVPNIFGLSIRQARAKLAFYGWRPNAHAKESSADGPPYDRATDLRKQGMTEVDECSGTGWGFCGAGYHHANGAKLGIATVGDGPEQVSDYEVTCPK